MLWPPRMMLSRLRYFSPYSIDHDVETAPDKKSRIGKLNSWSSKLLWFELAGAKKGGRWQGRGPMLRERWNKQGGADKRVSEVFRDQPEDRSMAGKGMIGRDDQDRSRLWNTGTQQSSSNDLLFLVSKAITIHFLTEIFTFWLGSGFLVISWSTDYFANDARYQADDLTVSEIAGRVQVTVMLTIDIGVTCRHTIEPFHSIKTVSF